MSASLAASGTWIAIGLRTFVATQKRHIFTHADSVALVFTNPSEEDARKNPFSGKRFPQCNAAIVYPHPPIYPPIHPSTHTPIHPSIHPPIHPSPHPPIYPSIHRFIHPSIHPSIHSFAHPSAYPPTHSSIYPYTVSIHLSIHPSI